MDAWKLGVKAIAIYRDGCKVAQPLQTKGSEQQLLAAKPSRRMMPIDRNEIGRKFQVGEYEGYIHVGLFPEGDPGDIFVDIAKEGTTLAGLMNAFMIAVSVGIQYGVPLEVFVSKFAHMRFEPSGMTNDPDIRIAKSIPDYIFRWMGKRFLDAETQAELGIMSAAVREQLANGNGHSPAVPSDEPAPQARPRPASARRRSSTPGRTRSSARSAAAARCAPARATPAATAATTRAAAELTEAVERGRGASARAPHLGRSVQPAVVFSVPVHKLHLTRGQPVRAVWRRAPGRASRGSGRRTCGCL